MSARGPLIDDVLEAAGHSLTYMDGFRFIIGCTAALTAAAMISYAVKTRKHADTQPGAGGLVAVLIVSLMMSLLAFFVYAGVILPGQRDDAIVGELSEIYGMEIETSDESTGMSPPNSTNESTKISVTRPGEDPLTCVLSTGDLRYEIECEKPIETFSLSPQ